MSDEYYDGRFETGSIADIPQEVLDGIVKDQLGIFSVGLLGVKAESTNPSLQLCGSGTLVFADGAHYILTAAHVWSKKLRIFDHVALTLKERDFHEFVIKTSFIEPHASSATEDEWGPDLCFLRIPPANVGTIDAYKAFYNLSKRREFALSHAVEPSIGTWVLMGVPATESVIAGPRGEFQFLGGFSTIQGVHRRGELDYLDFGVNLSKDPPSSFGGMSGGGLWQMDIERRQKKDGTYEWNAAGSLEGIAFYQTSPANGRRVIRCHGRRSIYLNIPSLKSA